jgi:hypothetical protein
MRLGRENGTAWAYDTFVKIRPYAEGLLVPAVPMTYRFATAKLVLAAAATFPPAARF